MLHFSVKHFASLDSRATIKVKNRLLEGCYNLYSFGHWGKKKKTTMPQEEKNADWKHSSSCKILCPIVDTDDKFKLGWVYDGRSKEETRDLVRG